MDDELRHWKYLKRWREKGEWKYLYPDDVKKKMPKPSETTKNQTKPVTSQSRGGSGGTTSKEEGGIFDRIADAVDEYIDSYKERQRNKREEYGPSIIDRGKEWIEEKIEDAKENADDLKEDLKELVEEGKKWIETAIQDFKDAFADPEEPVVVEYNEHLTDLNVKTENMTRQEDQAAVNPNYEEGIEYQINCGYCTAAYDLRRRGYDVEAMPYEAETYDATPIGIASWYEDTTIDDWITQEALEYHEKLRVYFPDYDKIPEMYENTKKQLETMPDGAYGQFCVYWSTGGGHSMVWEKEDGKIKIRDCQSNETYDYDKWVRLYSTSTYAAYILRTDNRTPSEKIRHTVRNRDTTKKKEKVTIKYDV